MVLKEIIQPDFDEFRTYFSGPVYLDGQLDFYRALTYALPRDIFLSLRSGGKLVRHSPLLTLFRPIVWKGMKRAEAKGVKNGSLKGDAS